MSKTTCGLRRSRGPLVWSGRASRRRSSRRPVKRRSGTACSRRRRRRAARRRSNGRAPGVTTSSSPGRSAARRSRATCSGRSTRTTTSGRSTATCATTCRRTARRSSPTTIKADILAYIMSMNGMPSGNDELKADVRALEVIKIAKKTTWDGVFTAAQAERGKQNFLTGRCGGCHKLDLTGDRGPALKGRRLPRALGERQRRHAVRQDPRDDAAQLAERDDRRREDRHRGLPAAAERLSGGQERASRRSRQPRHHRPRAQGTDEHDCEFLAGAGGGVSDARGRTTPGCSRNTSEPVLTRDEEPSQAALQDGAEQVARRADVSAGERRPIQARDAQGPEDGSERPACTGIRTMPASTSRRCRPSAPGARTRLSQDVLLGSGSTPSRAGLT